jgi:hypothetical protein
VNVYGCPMIVTANAFWQGCKLQEARDWILANAMYMRVDAVTWESPPSAA